MDRHRVGRVFLKAALNRTLARKRFAQVFTATLLVAEIGGGLESPEGNRERGGQDR
jgi:hypothetical protein